MTFIDEKTKMAVKKDGMIRKFCMYGFLKNLKFFEPYLVIHLLSLGMDFLSVGILYSIREAVVMIFEVPSGILADTYGKKKELMACFVFYIASFILFFFGKGFYLLASAMFFFGLGEAFRSGTHKAMIYSYLERRGWFGHKTYVYGRTRGFSLLGSSISAFFSILLALNLPALRWIFLLSVLPYVLDFALIASYPDYLDEKGETSLNPTQFLRGSLARLRSISGNRELRKALLSSSIFDGLFKSIKDYVQPVLEVILIGGIVFEASGLGEVDELKIYLGVTYGVFYIFSSMASRNVYRLKRFAGSRRLMDIFFDLLGVGAIFVAVSIRAEMGTAAVAMFFVMYLLKDARRPLFVDVSGDIMKKTERATALSVESQLRSVFMIVSAPLFGFIADRISIAALFAFVGITSILGNRFLARRSDS